MTAYPHYAERDAAAPLATDMAPAPLESEAAMPHFDDMAWAEQRDEQSGAGGRQVLGSALALLAALWLGYTAWSAGRALAALPLNSPAFAQWVAIAAGPLALARSRRAQTARTLIETTDLSERDVEPGAAGAAAQWLSGQLDAGGPAPSVLPRRSAEFDAWSAAQDSPTRGPKLFLSILKSCEYGLAAKVRAAGTSKMS